MYPGELWLDRIDCQVFHIVDENIDTGSVITYKNSVLPEYYTKPKHLIDYSNKKIIDLYKEFITKIKKKFKLQKQRNIVKIPSKTVYENKWLDRLSFNSDKLIRFINAFETPYQGASTLQKQKSF